MLILICGLPATGKSTLSRNLAKKIDAHVLRTDIIRKELFENPEYTQEEKKVVYKATFLMARYLLRAGEKVIIDGTFYKRALRKKVYKIAHEARVKLVVIECMTPQYVIKNRMERRGRRKTGPSDADFEVYLKLKNEFQPIKRQHITVDTSRHFKDNLRDILGKMWL